MKKGFTLIELLAVVVILGVVALITVPNISKIIDGSREKSYNNQIEIIKKATNDFVLRNTHCLPEGNDFIVITLGMLKKGINDPSNVCNGDSGGYIDKDIKNPKTGKLFDDGLQIKIQKFNNTYAYNVIDSDTPIVEPNPTIVLNGTKVMNISKNTSFVDPGVIAKTSTGETITNILITYEKNGLHYESVDVSTIGTYKITYSVVSNNKKAIAVRTVNIY